jgi:hypothetical protein
MSPSRVLLLVLPAALLCSCASVSVQNVASENGRAQKPRAVVVNDFSLQGAQIKENQFRKNHGQLGSEAQRLVANYLVKDLQEMGLKVSRGGSRGPSDLVIEGRFTRINEGSRILRMGIGLGIGGTKMETQVQVRQGGAGQPLLRFATTGGSNANPGAATNPIPFSSAPTALLASKEGVTDDAARTARQIAAQLGEYMVKRGWIDPARVKVKVKQKGEIGPMINRG